MFHEYVNELARSVGMVFPRVATDVLPKPDLVLDERPLRFDDPAEVWSGEVARGFVSGPCLRRARVPSPTGIKRILRKGL